MTTYADMIKKQLSQEQQDILNKQTLEKNNLIKKYDAIYKIYEKEVKYILPKYKYIDNDYILTDDEEDDLLIDIKTRLNKLLNLVAQLKTLSDSIKSINSTQIDNQRCGQYNIMYTYVMELNNRYQKYIDNINTRKIKL